MGFEHFKIGKAGAPFRHTKGGSSKRADSSSSTPDPSCATGAFYTAPAMGSSVDATSPLNVAWQPSLNCFQPTPSKIDIYLDNPGADSPRLHLWEGVDYATGNYTLNMMPSWWNSTSSATLQFMVVPTGTPPFLSAIPAGPVITATYTSNATTPVAADTSDPSSDTTVVSTTLSGVSTHSMSAGKKAAAVLLPLLFVILLGLAYIKVSRARGAAKRSEWSEKLDKRMSMISADWKSITPGGAKEAIRASMAQRNSTASAFSFGAVRPGNVEGDPVIMGEKPLAALRSSGSIDISEKDLPRTSLGSGVGVGVGARRPRTHATPPDRSSRAVSFADAAHPRPSLSSAYSRGSRAFHTASTYNDFADEDAPPVPALPSPSRTSAYGQTSPGAPGNRVSSVYNNAAWSSGERVEGVDGGYGARSVSPTGRVHTINYPSASALSTTSPTAGAFAYGDESDLQASYFSPTTPTPTASRFPGSASPTTPDSTRGVYAYEPSAESAYAATTFGEYHHPQQQQHQYGGASPSASDVSSGGLPSGLTSPRQTAGPLTLTPEDIRRRMTAQHGPTGEGAWRQSVDDVLGALSMMRTGGTPSSSEAEDEGGDYLFAPAPETVFAYPGTPAASSFNSTAPIAASPMSPFAMPMPSQTASPDDMLRAYASSKKHTSVAPGAGAEVVQSLSDTGMRVLYKQPEGAQPQQQSILKGALIRAGKGARLSK